MQFIHLSEVDSTQLEAKRLLKKQPDMAWMAVVADFQTQGRGQWNRQWTSMLGNLHVTYITPTRAHSQIGLRMVEVVYHGLGHPNIQFKWPNDLFIEGKKCGGILCEAWGETHTLIGLGLNISKAPDGFGCLKLSTSPIVLAQAIGHQLETWDMTKDRPWNLPPLLYQNEWIDHTAPNGEIRDIYVEGVSLDGALKAKGKNGEAIRLHSGRLGLAGART